MAKKVVAAANDFDDFDDDKKEPEKIIKSKKQPEITESDDDDQDDETESDDDDGEEKKDDSSKINDVKQIAWASRKIGRVIKAFCYECMHGSYGYIDGCSAPRCPLFPFRNVKSIKKGFDEAVVLLKKEGNIELAKQSEELRDSRVGSFKNIISKYGKK